MYVLKYETMHLMYVGRYIGMRSMDEWINEWLIEK